MANAGEAGDRPQVPCVAENRVMGGRPVKKIRIYYRAPTHVPLWKVMEEAGFLAKHGLEMEFGSLEDKRARATQGLLTGELDVVSGNHHNLYARRALHGEPFVHIGQVHNQLNQH